MKYMPIERLRTIADVRRQMRSMSRRERLARWAEVLERDPLRTLNSLPEIELLPRQDRATFRVDNSPLSVAFADPVLREEGLRGDTIGDALPFFGLSMMRLHTIACSCLYGRSMTQGAAARAIRSAAEVRPLLGTAGLAGLIAAAPLLIYLFH